MAAPKYADTLCVPVSLSLYFSLSLSLSSIVLSFFLHLSLFDPRPTPLSYNPLQAIIYSIAFSRNSDRLACASSHGTLHLFVLAGDPSIPEPVAATQTTRTIFGSLSPSVYLSSSLCPAPFVSDNCVSVFLDLVLFGFHL